MSTEPAQTLLQPTEKRKRGIRLSIRAKITFWAGLCSALVSLILIGYSVLTFREKSIEDATREAAAIAEAKAGSVTKQLDLPLFAARTLAYSLSAIKDPSIPVSLSRDEVNGMLRKLLIENHSFLGIYTLWEPNVFDGADAKYVRAVAHDDTGRFIPYWVRGDNGIIHTEALTQYEIPGVGDWYILPRSNMQEVTIAPIIRRIQDQDVVIASFIIPIVQNDIFYGIAGVDAPIDFVQQFADEVDLYDGTTNAVLFTDTGMLIAVRQQPDLSGQPANLIYEDFDNIQSRLDSSFTRLSPDGKYLQIFSPIQVSGGEDIWVMGLIIPFEKITAPATNTAIRQVAISAVFILLALVFLWFVAGQMVRPLRTLTNAAKALSHGDLTVTADVHSNDEAEVLADAFNSMTLQLKTLFSTLEQRVAARTRALATTTEVSHRLSTIFNQEELVSEVVNQVQSAFGYYHAHIYLAEGDELVMAGGTGEAGAEMLAGGHKLSKGRGLVGRAAETNQAVLVSDTTQDPDWLPNELLPNTKSEVAIPISTGDQVLGVLDIQHDVTDGLSQEDVDSLQSIANQVAIALQNIRQFEKARKTASELELAANVSTATSRIIESKHLLQEVVDLTKRTFDLYHVHIYLLDPNSKTLTLAAGAGEVGKQMMAEGWEIPMDHQESIVASTARDHRPIIINDVNRDKDSAFLSNRLLPDTRSEMAVPMVVGEKTLGVFDLQANTADYFSDEDARIFTILASQVTVALQNAESYMTAQKQAERETKLNTIAQKIQSTATIEEAMQVTARELGHALGKRQTFVALNTAVLVSEGKDK